VLYRFIYIHTPFPPLCIFVYIYIYIIDFVSWFGWWVGWLVGVSWVGFIPVYMHVYTHVVCVYTRAHESI